MKFNYILSFATLFLTLHTVPAFSAQPFRAIEVMQDTSIATPYVLETKWYYRYVNGEYQKRLWSVSQNKWLTNWISVSS